MDDQQHYILTAENNNVIFGIGIPQDALYGTRMRETITFAFYLLFIYIISEVHRIVHDLHDIQKGQLDLKVDVKTALELETLSQDINAMVQTILNAIFKVSQIIEMTDIPIAAFECRQDLSYVLVTPRLQILLHFDDYEANELFKDKRLFLID